MLWQRWPIRTGQGTQVPATPVVDKMVGNGWRDHDVESALTPSRTEALIKAATERAVRAATTTKVQRPRGIKFGPSTYPPLQH